MAEVYCGSEPCPLFLNSTCVFYTGESLLYIGVQTNDTLEAIIVKINQAFQNTGIGYAFTNGVIQPTPSQPVQLGGALIQNTTIGGNFTLTFSGNVQAAKHITTGGSSSQFVKGDGTLDSTAYQPAANYITGLSGDVLASGPGVAAATLATVNFSSGTFGNGNTIPIVTVNSKGLVTNITPTPINLPPISLTFIGDVVGSGLTGSNITLLLQNVNPNPYNTITPLKFSVNGKGLVTSASPITASDIVNILGYSPSGTAGSSGTSGTTGTSGTSGTSGIDGTFGTSGTSGTSGSSATSGTSGTSGSSGTSGTSGSTGTSGSSGTTGTSGSSGTTGTSGSSGTSGTTGTSGSSGTSGTTGTSGSSGLSGDRFKTTSTTTYTLQAPGNPGTLTVDPGLSYTVAQSIIIAYDANNHNEAEVTSYNSITGVINFVTFTLTGSGTYSNWFVNIDGASGGDGSSGSSGTTGTSGSSGTSGTTGTSGSSGTSGTTGTSGSSGTSGTSATDGTGGTSGTSGSSATSGTSGTSGTSATSGTSGTSGTNGGTGASGTSGTSGTSVTVSGTTNTLAKFTSSTTIGDSLFTDNGINGALGGANYTSGTGLRSFNISAQDYPALAFWANNQQTASIFGLGFTGTLTLSADPSNIFSDSKIVMSTDGTERLTIFNNGNVSIANSPTDAGFKLDVNGTGRFGDNVTISASFPSLILSRAGTTFQQDIKFQDSGSNRWSIGQAVSAVGNTLDFYSHSFGQVLGLNYSTGAATFSSSVRSLSLDVISASGVGSSTASGLARFITAGTTTAISVGQANSGRRLDISSYNIATTGEGLYLQTLSNHPIYFSTNSVDKAIITSSGNVGIGTVSPESLSNNTTLQIDGTNHSFVRTGNSNYGGYFATIPTAEVLCISNVRNPVTGTYNNTGKAASGINLFSESSNGYITFLTTATNNVGPTERMRITSGGDVYLNNAAALFFGPTSVTYLSASTTTMVFAVNTGERMRITSVGTVGINKSSPDANSKLDVNGQAFVAHLAIYNDNGTPSLGTSPMLYSPASATLAISTGTVERMRINSVGQVGIGTPTPSVYNKLTVTGSIGFNNNTDVAIASNEYGQAYSRRTSAVVGGGSATSIKSGLGPEASTMVVCGRSPTGARFADLVLVIGQGTTAPLVIGSRQVGAAPSRTYTNGGENLVLQLTGSSETFVVFVTGIGGNELT